MSSVDMTQAPYAPVSADGTVWYDARTLARFGQVAAELLDQAGDRVDDPAWVALARHAWEDVPAEIRRTVREFRRHSGPDGALVLRRLPIGAARLPLTPMVKGSVQHGPSLPAATLLLFAAGLGDPAAFAAEKSGALVQDVVPVPGQETVQGNVGSVELTFHTENAFHPHRPDYVMLLCLRPDHEGTAELRTSCARRVLPLLTSGTREALGRPEYVTEAPPSFGPAGESTAHAVLTGDPDDPDWCFDEAATKAVTPEGRAALAELAEVAHRTYTGVLLRPGDLAVVDNRITLHGRSAFTPRYDGHDRWLQRTFAFTDLRRSRDHRPGDGTVLVK
ncbi:TauD/TfdA family dioxygenase [Streptomyces ipomoeae]|uniref:TauD/TfdA family dioxygenase n=1 Tax=Streptomyces ipomoeae TaxID=103232 RepID=UPI0011478361|nr:TauD/TfdA family dioxygenase [Streptomyces ipomoeae]MDX2937033.1 TauD/TfdA family dioxygenase [Streptomyces ipomoeae]TQE26187.1 L-asparagine oxygenase [Streptomyces ipomoeae]